jgi:hypothetical protein
MGVLFVRLQTSSIAMNLPSSNVYVLSRINKALRADFQHLSEADGELQAMLHDLRRFGERFDGLHDDPKWDGAWLAISGLLDEIRLYTLRMREEMESEAASPLAAFDVVLARDTLLHQKLEEVCETIGQLVTPAEREDWLDLYDSLQAQLDVIRAYLAATRVRIEMRRKHGAPESERLREEILRHLPADATLEEAGQFTEEYERAFQQFQRDKYRTGGIIDIFKALLLIQEEGPEARARRKMHKDEV